MSAPEHVPVGPLDAPRVGDLERFPPPRRPEDRVVRHADMTTVPRESGYGTPAPDAGFALLLAERFADRLQLAPGEHLRDAYFAASMLAIKRASRFGRGPVITDVEIGFTLLGYLGDGSSELARWRAHDLAGIAHDYHLQRHVANLVADDVLAQPVEQIRSRPDTWLAAFGLVEPEKTIDVTPPPTTPASIDAEPTTDRRHRRSLRELLNTAH
ncbi:MAG TPA: hypothetical protein VIR58_13410 [Acidimicrobiales bacterium]